MKSFLTRVFAMHPLAFAACLCMLVLTFSTYRAIDALPRTAERQGELTREYIGRWLTANVTPQLARLVATVDGLPPMTRDLVDKHASRIETAAAGEIRHGVDRGLEEVRDFRTDSGAKVDAALSIVRELHTSAKPVLANAAALAANSAALVKDAQDSLDDSYYDLKALIESATVATTSAAQSSEVFRNAFPKLLAQTQAFTTHTAGITADVHSMTTEIDHRYFHPPPMTFKQKVWSGFKNAVFLGASAARIAK